MLDLRICRLCGEERPLIKAHIIPEAFFRELRGEGEAPLMVTNNPKVFPKRAPIGVYDQEILCGSCEAKFGRCDAYGAEVLLNRRDELFKPLIHVNEVLAFSAEGIDQTLLATFFVAVLWRASVTSQVFFANIQLGPYEEVAKQVFLGASPESAPIFATVLSRWTTSHKRQNLTTAMMNPFAERWDSINAYRIYFGEHVAYIKTDKRPYTDPWKSMQIGSHKNLFVTTRDFDESKELRVMKMVADAAPVRKRREVQTA